VVDRSLKILQVNSSDISGGAQKVGWNLFRAYRGRGCQSSLVVGYKESDDPGVFAIQHSGTANDWSFFWWKLYARLQRLDRNGRASRLARKLLTPRVLIDTFKGKEDFHFPGTWDLLNLTGRFPDILHCHNLHGGYFDLTALPYLSRRVPTVLTLHDAWLLSGHCAHSLGCERWRIGCGECPDLSLYPDIRRDATAFNWERKRALYAKSSFYVATPSHWLMRQVEASILALGMIEGRVIANGVDLTVFHPADRRATRAAMGLVPEAQILLFTANGIRENVWKDYQTLRAAITYLAERLEGHKLIFLALGEDGPAERVGQAEIRFIPYQKNPQSVARYYQAADIYIHAARADTFPNSVIEALACGAPIVATAVGGIKEQVKSLQANEALASSYGLDQATGILTSPHDALELAMRIEQLLKDGALRHRLSENAAKDARVRFALERQADDYLNWYEEIRESFISERREEYDLARA